LVESDWVPLLRQLFVFPLKGFIHNLIGSRLK
jgi:hypothetical protein